MTTKTVSTILDQAHAINTLIALVGAFPDLPAATIHVQRTSAIGDLRINVHSGPADFEQWREALRLDPSTVDLREMESYASLETEGDWLGARVELIGYLDQPIRQQTSTDTSAAVAA